MLSFYIKFKNYDRLVCRINDTPDGRTYVKLLSHMCSKQPPVFRDRIKYTKEYMQTLAREANDRLGWKWDFDDYSLDITTTMHKDIESLVGSTSGFSQIPADLDHLIHELHYCLHLVQDGHDVSAGRDAWLQLEWFNDIRVPLTDTGIFELDPKFGDIKLQNPYVGHGPLQIFLEKDFSKISQTCKFHDVIKPGINVLLGDIPKNFDTIEVIDKFVEHAPDFVATHGVEKIKEYIGYPIIGKIENLDTLVEIKSAPVLELEEITFK